MQRLAAKGELDRGGDGGDASGLEVLPCEDWPRPEITLPNKNNIIVSGSNKACAVDASLDLRAMGRNLLPGLRRSHCSPSCALGEARFGVERGLAWLLLEGKVVDLRSIRWVFSTYSVPFGEGASRFTSFRSALNASVASSACDI